MEDLGGLLRRPVGEGNRIIPVNILRNIIFSVQNWHGAPKVAPADSTFDCFLLAGLLRGSLNRYRPDSRQGEVLPDTGLYSILDPA